MPLFPFPDLGSLLLQGSLTGVLSGVGPKNDWDPGSSWTTTGTVILVDASTVVGPGYQLTGLVGGIPGRAAILQITALAIGVTLSMAHDSLLSAPQNRFLLPSAGSVVLPAFGAIVLRYDATALRWRYASS